MLLCFVTYLLVLCCFLLTNDYNELRLTVLSFVSWFSWFSWSCPSECFSCFSRLRCLAYESSEHHYLMCRNKDAGFEDVQH